MEDFFTANPLLVKQPQRIFVDRSEYFCFNKQGAQIAHVDELNADAGMQVARFLMSNYGANFGRKVVVHDAWRRPRLYIEKHWSVLTATTTVSAPNGQPIGHVEQDFKLFKAGFQLLNAHRQFIGSIEGNFGSYEFAVYDHQHHEVGRVNRQLPDLGEAFTSADTYVLWKRYPQLPEPLSTMVVASTMAIDLVLREGRR